MPRKCANDGGSTVAVFLRCPDAMRVAVVAMALFLATAALRSGRADAHPALIAARAAQAASKAAQAVRAASRAMKLSRMTKMLQRARKGMNGLKAPGSLNRMRSRMQKKMQSRIFERMRNGAMDRHNAMRKLMARRTTKMRSSISTFAKRQLQNRSFAQQLNRRNMTQRLSQMHRQQQRRQSAQRNTDSAQSQRSRMRRSAESASHRRGMFASALAH